MSKQLKTNLIDIKGIGTKLATHLAKIHLYCLEDLLFHLPHRYLDHTRIYPIESLYPGQHVLVEGVVEKKNILPKPKRSLLIKINDGTASMSLRFFHFHPNQMKFLSEGVRLRCSGEIRHGRWGIEMVHPEYVIMHSQQEYPVNEHLTPIYPSTEGIGQRTLRKLVAEALLCLQDDNCMAELLPKILLEKFQLPSLKEALFMVHQPRPDIACAILERQEHPAQLRLAFEELLAHHLMLQKIKQNTKKYFSYPVIMNAPAIEQFVQQFPFQLTSAQRRAIDDLKMDFYTNTPMMRLVQGDVGSGKTVVAAVAAFIALSSGYQVAMMAPTEILAQQHYDNFSQWFAKKDYSVSLLKSQLAVAKKRQIQSEIEAGHLQMVIGTHALFQEDVCFKKLGLVIVDEQHRFGVVQRLALQTKGQQSQYLPHQLVMTATPIPRTLAMTMYADLDYTVIDELPPGRKKISTVAISQKRRPEVIERCLAQCHAGRQVYWVCTLIEASEQLNANAAEIVKQDLEAAMPDISIGLVHGKMKSQEKEIMMQQFKQGQINLLVATTVIEVGVDVPNASLMIIENPERLGLSQLHQLRGRVGRGSLDSFCILLYQEPLSAQAKARLDIMRQSQDGFWIAEQDLALRGFGELLGTRQTGLLQFKVAKWQMIGRLLTQLEQAAMILSTKHSAYIPPLIQRWLPEGDKYLNA